MIGGMEIIVILCIILLLFGGKRLPEFARNLGQGLREFRKASQEISSELSQSTPKSSEDEHKDKVQ
ncbi:MAG: twin-arginine translocase TatA/TatE family subunit [Chlamydiia bacterium]|nr:twin-arginine translocase TatA/TatE family subunit [Chlamydiia bacterium]